jgi:hypothetical protein
MGIVEVYHKEKQEIEHCMEDNLLLLWPDSPEIADHIPEGWQAALVQEALDKRQKSAEGDNSTDSSQGHHPRRPNTVAIAAEGIHLETHQREVFCRGWVEERQYCDEGGRNRIHTKKIAVTKRRPHFPFERD